ncbi:hypothetical protein JHL17_34155 [Azospirillum sp. YIM B02556]|uniref:PAS domain-containing protein n=1 Tax=Azospirillum endophyticum TaxID=2800326 RepID=A0ABS1FG90_9PROT|nr:hypothetical protein [Azospirillum endophyticum]MBK1842451.1 hypothetical protein [Azospirillum endophyticum]
MTILAFPTQDRGAQRPAVRPETSIARLTLAEATDWQRTIMAECRRQRVLSPSLPAFLKRAGLMDRCTFLSSAGPAKPLCFRHLGVPTLSVLGRAWGRAVINQPDEADPHVEFAHSVGAQYAESIGAGEAVFNRVTVSGVGQPFVYTHALYGWEDRGRRAVLSAVDVQTLH